MDEKIILENFQKKLDRICLDSTTCKEDALDILKDMDCPEGMSQSTFDEFVKSYKKMLYKTRPERKDFVDECVFCHRKLYTHPGINNADDYGLHKNLADKSCCGMCEILITQPNRLAKEYIEHLSNYENGEDIFINKLIDQIYIINNCIQGNQFSHLRNDQITKIKEIFNEK